MVLQWPPFLYSIFNKKGEAVKKGADCGEEEEIQEAWPTGHGCSMQSAIKGTKAGFALAAYYFRTPPPFHKPKQGSVFL